MSLNDERMRGWLRGGGRAGFSVWKGIIKFMRTRDWSCRNDDYVLLDFGDGIYLCHSLL